LFIFYYKLILYVKIINNFYHQS